MAGVGAWLVANATTVSAVGAIASTALTASTAHRARVDARNATSRQVLARNIAERQRKRAKKVQEGILSERSRERRGQGFAGTLAAGRSRSLGVGDTGGKSLLG
jgi:hypothetical protein